MGKAQNSRKKTYSKYMFGLISLENSRNKMAVIIPLFAHPFIFFYYYFPLKFCRTDEFWTSLMSKNSVQGLRISVSVPNSIMMSVKISDTVTPSCRLCRTHVYLDSGI